MKKEHECIIIGGGAAGMMAAITLAGYGIETCILEHTSRIGTKILQTGNGKCNFTNLNMDETMYQNKDTKWVMDVINRFNVDAVLDFFKGIGIYHKEKNGYVYPLSMTASSLQNALRLELENKLEIKLGFITAPSDTVHKYKTNADLFRLNSKCC